MGQLSKIGIVFAWAVVFTMTASVAADDRIEFGPPGSPQTIAFHDGVVSASVTFRISHDARYDKGPAGVSPSISSGSLAVRAYGKSRRYNLLAILPIKTDRVILSRERDCGTATALSRRNGYLVVESVLAEKGCTPLATFINLHDGRVAKETVFDPAWAHRFDVHAYHASGAPIHILRVERVVPEGSRASGGTTSTKVAWPFMIVHATDARRATLMFAVDLGNQLPNDESAVAFTAGNAAFTGKNDIGDPDVLVQSFIGELFVRLGTVGEARFDARQTPTPENLEAVVRHNHWYDGANERARRGDFVGAVDAFATMASFHGGGGDIDASDAAMLATCRALEKRVRAGAVRASVARGAFSNGCVLQPPQHLHPTPKVST